MRHADWLDVYSKAVLQQELDMEQVIRKTKNEDDFVDDLLEKKSQ